MGIFDWLSGTNKEDKPQMTEFQAREQWSSRNDNEFTIRRGPKRLISTTELPAQYNDVKLSGVRVVNGKGCRTVGELKEATEKFYRNK